MNRLRLAWHVLRGRAVMYRCALALDGARLYVGARSGSGPLFSVENAAGDHLIGPAEVGVWDFEQELHYALQVEDRTP